MKLKNGWNIMLRSGKCLEYHALGWHEFVIGCYISHNEEGVYFGGIKKGFALRLKFWIPFDGLQWYRCSNPHKNSK